MSHFVTENNSNISDDSSSSSQSSAESTTPSSLSMFEQNPDHPQSTNIPTRYEIPKSIINNLFIPNKITLNNLFNNTEQKPNVNPIGYTLKPITDNRNSSIKTEATDHDNEPLRRSNRKRDTKFDYRNRIDTLFNRKELALLTLDELLAKAMSFDPDIRWNVDAEWCRYCGARASIWFDKSPWGRKQLCAKHSRMWKENKLDLSHFAEPRARPYVINKADCTERQYLIDIICDDLATSSYTSSSSDTEMIKRETKTSHIIDVKQYSYKCKECDGVFVSPSIFKEHSQRMHGIEKPFDCPQCDKSYLNKGNLDYHIRKIHNGEINYHCEWCKKPFFNKSELKQHVRVHTKAPKVKQSLFECIHCNQQFKKKHYMKRHIINMHTANKDKPYQCSYCMYGAATKWQIDTHEDIHRNERRYKCKFCGRGFNAKKNMERHVLNDHVKPYKCAHCDRGFGTVGYLQSHVINVHTKNKDKPYHCNVCDYGASSLRRVKKHQLIHSNVRPFKCGQCEKSFKTLNYLHSHLNRVHEVGGNNVRKSECNVCGKRFATSYLKYHVLSHSNIKPYKCSKCDYATQFKKRLEKHEMTHNAEKAFECDICYKRFRVKWYVETHKRNVHRNGKGGKISLPRKPKDAECPKKPLTSYFVFAKEVREDVKKQFNGYSITQIAKEISKKWNKLNEEEKKPYFDEAQRLKLIYTQIMKEYKATNSYKKHEKRLKKWKMQCDRIKREKRKAKSSSNSDSCSDLNSFSNDSQSSSSSN